MIHDSDYSPCTELARSGLGWPPGPRSAPAGTLTRAAGTPGTGPLGSMERYKGDGRAENEPFTTMEKAPTRAFSLFLLGCFHI